MRDVIKKIDGVLREEVKLNSIEFTGTIREVLEAEFGSKIYVDQRGNNMSVRYRDSDFNITVRSVD